MLTKYAGAYAFMLRGCTSALSINPTLRGDIST